MRESQAIAVLLGCFLTSNCEHAQEQGRVSTPPAVSAFVERIAEPRQPAAGKPPLLVLVHGIGADENDLFPIAGALDGRFKVVSLRAPQRYAVGHAWFQIDFRPDGTVVPDVAQARRARADLAAWIKEAPARHGTDPARTYLLGFSQGAMMSIGILQTAPEHLAGVIALSGRDPSGLFEATAERTAIARVPLLVAHGTYDDLLPVTHGRATRDAFSALSSDFTYREFPVGHGVSEDEIDLIADWLERRLGRP